MITGTVKDLIVDDRVLHSTTRYVAVQLDDHRRFTLRGPGTELLARGERVQATGQPAKDTFLVSGYHVIASAATSAQPIDSDETQGTLGIVHADNFEQGLSAYSMVVRNSNDQPTLLQVAVIPEVLRPGMQVIARGKMAPNAASLDVSTITILAPPADTQDPAAAPITNNVLVVLVQFPGGAGPAFTQAQVDQVMRTNAGSVANYYQEVSYGQQLLNVTVTPWLVSASGAPGACDFTAIGNAGDAAASAAGYAPGNYQNRFYVFPFRGDCGWAGLAYVGFGRAWSNGYNQLNVYAHELGHNVGLYHAASLSCLGQVIGGSCSSSEYGDPFDVMGNTSAMHFNAKQKSILNWIPAASVQTHSAGSARYTLSPIESAGGSTYAVKIPVAANRIYWLEYRQPIGFDSGMSSYPNNGAQIRVSTPFEFICGGCGDDTELLDMTPGSAGNFGDSALTVGQTYVDNMYGTTISVLSADGAALTVQVTAPGGASPTSTSLAGSPNPAPAGVSVTFTASVTGSAPTGTVNFKDGASSISGCAASPVTGSGNVRAATCIADGLGVGTHSIVATYSGDGANAPSSSAALSQIVNASGGAFSNGGFEAPYVGGGTQYAPSGTAWVFTAGAGITGNGNDFTNGNGPAPEGIQVAFLQGNGTAAQTATVAAGSYTLSLQAAQRGNYQLGTQIVAVQVDGVTVGQFQPPGVSYTSYSTPAFTIASSGNHTITLRGVGSGNDFTAFVDDVRLGAPSAPGFSNGGFEAPSVAGGYQYAPSGATWVFTGGAGITGNGNGFTVSNGSAPEGAQVGFLQGNGAAAQAMTLAAGSYTLSLQAAQRGSYQVGTQIVAVQVDGVTVGQFQPPGVSYTSYSTPAFTIASSGSHTITLRGVGSGTDFTAFVDDVRLASASAPAFSNGSFEVPNLAGGYQYAPPGATWAFTGGAGMTSNSTGFTSGNGPAPDAAQVAFLQGNSSIAQAINLASGSYTLSIKAAQRGNYQVGTQIVAVQVDGVIVGQFQPPAVSYTSYSTPAFTIAASGNHTIALVGVGSGTDFTAFVDDVQLH